MVADIITITNRKGGCGKSTFTQVLAAEAFRLGTSVIVIDADEQENTVEWKVRRTIAGPLVLGLGGKSLTEQVRLHRDNCELLLIDTPPMLGDVVKEAIALADATIVPVKPSVKDLTATVATIQLIRAAHKRAGLVLNLAPTNGRQRLVAGTKAGLFAMGMPVCPTILHNRAAHEYADLEGLAAQEYEPNGEAAHEARQLWNWCRETVFN